VRTGRFPNPASAFCRLSGVITHTRYERLTFFFTIAGTLCLPNGERIKLNPNTMRMLFEVQDLAVASPATVSRCGMVYVPPEELGWRPFVRTFCATQLPAAATPEIRDWIFSLFDKCVDGGLKFLRKHLKEGITSVDINLVTSLAMLFKTLTLPSRGIDFGSENVKALKAVLAKVFVFSFTWSVGGNVDSTHHDKFDEFAREFLTVNVEAIGNLPNKNTVYDYFVTTNTKEEPKGRWTLWDDLVTKFSYNPATPYFEGAALGVSQLRSLPVLSLTLVTVVHTSRYTILTLSFPHRKSSCRTWTPRGSGFCWTSCWT
jgi:hypothetical protein